MAEFDSISTDPSLQKPVGLNYDAPPEVRPDDGADQSLEKRGEVAKAQPLVVPTPVLTQEAGQPGPKRGLNPERQNVLTTLGLQLLWVILMYLNTHYSAISHRISWPFPTIEEIAAYNFVGVTPENPAPSAAAIIVEVLTWSFLGVAARQIYYLYRNLIRNKGKQINALQLLSKLIAELTMGIAISAAVVAFFISTRLTIAEVELTLQNANLMSIIAISFVLGFYHEDTQRLLGSFHRGLSGRREREDEAKQDGEADD